MPQLPSSVWNICSRPGKTALLASAFVLLVAAVAISTAQQQTAVSALVTSINTAGFDQQHADIKTSKKHNVFVNLVNTLGAAVGAALFFTALIIGFLVFYVLVPAITLVAHFLLCATASVWVVIGLALAGAMAGLYYFRYYYAAPKKSAAAPGSKDDLKSGIRQGSGFDLHPDVTRVDDTDGANYMASLEARGNSIKHGGLLPGFDPHGANAGGSSGGMAGVGFPADFLSMFMKSISIFGYIEEPVFREFSRQLQTRRLLAGECMFDSEGDRDDQNFYVVIDGQVQVYLVDDKDTKTPEPTGRTADSTHTVGVQGSHDAAVGAALTGGWTDTYDDLAERYMSESELARASVPSGESEYGYGNLAHNYGGCDANDDIDETESLSEQESSQSSAILLNVVGPGDVLSSLFSILSLFTEDVPLKPSRDLAAKQSATLVPVRAQTESQQQQQQQQPSLPPQQPLLSEVMLEEGFPHSGVNQPTDSAGTRGAHQQITPGTAAAFDTQERQTAEAAAVPLSSNSPALSSTSWQFTSHQQSTGSDHTSRPPSSAYIRSHTQQQPKYESVREGGVLSARALRPNVIARATTDTTLAMIPGSAFQRVTRLYPKAATHILQVILTRLQRVTFATLYDYLDLPHELVGVERALTEFARCPLPADIGQSTLLHQIKATYAAGAAGDDDNKQTCPSSMPSPMFGARRPSMHSTKTTPSLTTSASVDGAGLNRLQPRWKVSHQNMAAMNHALQHTQQSLARQPVLSNDPSDIGSVHRHRRSGSDADRPGAVPSTEEIDALRTRVLCQLCYSIGLNPDTPDGRGTSTSEKQPSSATSTAAASRRASTHRRPLPRTEHLLPLLQGMPLLDQKQRAAGQQPQPKPLLEIPTLANDLELYHLPEGFTLVEQGKRPQGLYIILSGRVEITHRDSVSDFTGAIDARDEAASASQLSEATRRMTELAREANVRIESQDSKAKLRKHGYYSRGADYPKTRRFQRLDTAKLRTSSSDRAHRPYSLRAGDIVGYLPALTDMAAIYTARCRTNVVVGFVSRWALERISERFPIVLMTLARRLTARLPPAVLNIDYALEWIQVKASQMVYRQGEVSDAVYVVLSGRLRAFTELNDDGAASILAEYGQGQSVGEPNLLLSEPSRFNLHAIRDSELVRIPTALFKALMQTSPQLTFHLSRTLAMRAAQSLQTQGEQDKTHMSVLTTGVRCHNRNLKSVAIIPVNGDVPVHQFAKRLEQTLTGTVGRVALLDHTAMSRVLGRHAFSRIAGLKIVSWIAELEQRNRILLHVADGGIGSQWTRHCIRHSDFILLVGLGDGDPAVGDFERLLLALKTTARKELVLLHDNRSCRRGTTREWLRRRPWIHSHHHVQMPIKAAPSVSSNGRIRESVLEEKSTMIPPFVLSSLNALGFGHIRTSLERYYRRIVHDQMFMPATSQGHRSDFARLARYLCGTSVGVVLSGGGARGIALLGVLQAFEEAGIPVDMVGGTSIGALTAGLYAQTPDSVAIHGPLRAFARRMSSLWRFLLDVTYPILAYTTGREFNRAIWKVFRDVEIEDLWLPFYCMTANITRSRPEVHTAGLLWRVVRASMSLGGFVPPLCDENGDMLVDGGYLDNLPVQVMKTELGADTIFAIDIAGENDTSPVRFGASVSGFWVLLNHLNPFRSYWIPTLSEVQSRLTYASSDKELESAKVADSCVYLRVPPRDVGVLDFGRFDELYRRGYKYSKQWTAAWQQAGVLDRWQNSSKQPSTAQKPLATGGTAIVPATYNKVTRRNSI